jgi:hypothetical protein
MRSTVLVKSYFDVMYGGAVEKVVFVKWINDLDALVEKREATVLKLERSMLFDQARHLRTSQPAVPVSMPGRLKNSIDALPDIELAPDPFARSSSANSIVPFDDSPATAKLRDILSSQNGEVQRLQQEYAELAATHERRMTMRASKILASNFNLSEDLIDSLASSPSPEAGAVRHPHNARNLGGARRRVVSIDNDEDSALSSNSSFSPLNGRLSEVADEGDLLDSSEEEEDHKPPSIPPPPPPLPSSDAEQESPPASDDDLLGNQNPSRQVTKSSSLSSMLGNAFGKKQSSSEGDNPIVTTETRVDSSLPLEVNVIFVERGGEILKVALPNALMRVEYLKVAIEKKSGIKASSQALHLRLPGKTKPSSQHELIDGRTLDSHGVMNGSDITLVPLTNAAMLSTGEAPTSSRRQRLSITAKQSALIRGASGELWSNRSRLQSEEEPGNGTSTDGHKFGTSRPGPVLPLTRNVVDLLREVLLKLGRSFHLVSFINPRPLGLR